MCLGILLLNAIKKKKAGALGPSWSSLWLIFSTLWGEGWGGGVAVNHSESGQGGQAPLTLCTVGGGYLTWDWAPLATDTLTHSVPKQRNAPAPSLSHSWSRSDLVAAVPSYQRRREAPSGIDRFHRPGNKKADYGLSRHVPTLRLEDFF